MNLRDKIRLAVLQPRSKATKVVSMAGLLGIGMVTSGYYFYTTIRKSCSNYMTHLRIMTPNTGENRDNSKESDNMSDLIKVRVNEALANQHYIQNECADKLIKFYTTQVTPEFLGKSFVNSDGTIQKEVNVYYDYKLENKCLLGEKAFAEQRNRILTQLEKTWLPRGIRSVSIIYNETENWHRLGNARVTFKLKQ